MAGLFGRLGLSKHEKFAEYPARGLAAAETALLTIWPTLNRYHDDQSGRGGRVGCALSDQEGGWRLAGRGDNGRRFWNPGYATAVETLQRDFNALGADAPLRAAEFLRGTVEGQHRVREELVTAARYLLGD